MIDAQLTTEIFGFFSPARPDFAVEMAELPIQTTARFNAEWISKFMFQCIQWQLMLIQIFL